MTGAERQARYLARRATAERELRGEAGVLRSQVATLERDLADALAEVERLSSGPKCRHPAEAVQGGTCGLCGADIW